MSDRQVSDKKEKEWKDFLLKSSLPLEQLILEKLEYNHMYVKGEYPYIRPNEQNLSTEFSADFYAFQHLKRRSRGIEIAAKLSLLIECKYNYPGVKWVFSPYSRNTSMFLWSYYLEKEWNHKAFDLEVDLPICTRGIELNSSGFDPNTISRGLSQLCYGMPNLIIQEAQYLPSKNEFWPADETHIFLLLVTTADLYVLKYGQEIETYRSAESLDDVAEKVDKLIVAKERGLHLQQYCEELLLPDSNRHDSDRIISQKRVDNIFPWTFQIIVVQLDAFSNTVQMLQNVVRDIQVSPSSSKRTP